MKVVVIGATGNVGSATVRALAADRRIGEIVGVARRTPPSLADAPGAPRVRWESADISSDDLPFLAGADAVVHLAWQIQPSRDEPRDAQDQRRRHAAADRRSGRTRRPRTDLRLVGRRLRPLVEGTPHRRAMAGHRDPVEYVLSTQGRGRVAPRSGGTAPPAASCRAASDQPRVPASCCCRDPPTVPRSVAAVAPPPPAALRPRLPPPAVPGHPCRRCRRRLPGGGRR